MAIAAIATLPMATAIADDNQDEATAKKIAIVLRDSGRIKGYSIGVKFKNGTAWLAGRVTSKEQAATALKIVGTVDGVDQIVNNLTIGPAPSEPAGRPSSRRPQALKKSEEPQFADTSAHQVQLAAAAQAAPQQQLASLPQGNPAIAQCQPNSGGYKQLPPAYLNDYAQAQPMAGYNRPIPAYLPGMGGQVARATYDQAHMPNYAWPSYAAYPNYAALSYPKQYSASAWPFIGPFYPYPQVPLGWRRVALEWDDGWWFLDFDDRGCQ
jgi:hypothetical protein